MTEGVRPLGPSARALEVARPLITALENLRERGTIERAGPVLELGNEDLQHAARLVHECHQLDAAGVEDPEELLAEMLSSGTLFTADSSHLSERQGHRGYTRRLNDRMTLTKRE